MFPSLGFIKPVVQDLKFFLHPKEGCVGMKAWRCHKQRDISIIGVMGKLQKSTILRVRDWRIPSLRGSSPRQIWYGLAYKEEVSKCDSGGYPSQIEQVDARH
jgi:hypothetical protein